DGSMLVYAVERTSGQPREGVQVQVIRKKNDVTGGKTDKRGLLNLKVEDKTKAAATKDEADESAVEEGTAPLPEDETTTDSYLVMATEGDNFAISDLESYYFGGGGGGGEDEEGGGDSTLTSYIYTERPVYRPEQKVYFRGILRKRTDAGYKIPAG